MFIGECLQIISCICQELNLYITVFCNFDKPIERRDDQLKLEESNSNDESYIVKTG